MKNPFTLVTESLNNSIVSISPFTTEGDALKHFLHCIKQHNHEALTGEDRKEALKQHSWEDDNGYHIRCHQSTAKMPVL
jgi:hypothetical protein